MRMLLTVISLLVLFVFNTAQANDDCRTAGSGSATILGGLTTANFRQLTTPMNGEAVREAKSGCCSHHSGVCGCDTIKGRDSCCDGTTSPSCGC